MSHRTLHLTCLDRVVVVASAILAALALYAAGAGLALVPLALGAGAIGIRSALAPPPRPPEPPERVLVVDVLDRDDDRGR
jgi:hypothetical protein